MITSARLQHLRSYDDASFEFGPGVNIVLGPNASGKTSLLESVIVALDGKSYKARDFELVQTGAPWSRIDVTSEDHERVCKLIAQPDDTIQKEFVVDGANFKRLSYQKRFPVVLFEPNHLSLFHGSPDERRTYLDEILSRSSPVYGTQLRHYRRVLAQRNSLLKQPKRPTNEQLFVWNIRLSELGGQIATERIKLLASYNERISGLYSEIAGKETSVELTYVSPIDKAQYESHLLHALEQSVARDYERGFTGFGPHREDMSAAINGASAASAASRGEIRTLVLALKMLEADVIESATGKRPVLFLDDVFSELDGLRRQALVQFLAPYQSFITTTDADVVVDHFTDKATVIALA